MSFEPPTDKEAGSTTTARSDGGDRPFGATPSASEGRGATRRVIPQPANPFQKYAPMPTPITKAQRHVIRTPDRQRSGFDDDGAQRRRRSPLRGDPERQRGARRNAPSNPSAGKPISKI